MDYEQVIKLIISGGGLGVAFGGTVKLLSIFFKGKEVSISEIKLVVDEFKQERLRLLEDCERYKKEIREFRDKIEEYEGTIKSLREELAEVVKARELIENEYAEWQEIMNEYIQNKKKNEQ